MRKIFLIMTFALVSFTVQKEPVFLPPIGEDFLAQLNCSGPGCPNTNLAFPNPDAVSFAYPSPLTPSEQAGIYSPGNPAIRGYDESYAIVVGGDYTVPEDGGREVEGRVAVGGNLIINRESYGISQTGGGTFVVGAGGTTFPVAVNGTISGTGSLAVGFNKGGPYIVRSGGSNTLASSGAGSIGQTTSANQGSSGAAIAGIISGMQLCSENMCSTSSTGTFSSGLFTGSGAAQEVFSVNNSDIGANLVNFAGISPGATIVVNVKGTGDVHVNWTAQIGRAGEASVTDADAQIYNVIFNFCEASSVYFEVPFIGTSLIPNADVELMRPYEGRIYASGNLIHSGESSEVHNYPFTGNVTNYLLQLPVTLTSFLVSAEKDQNLVKWTTSSEVNFSHFEIYHSNDARNWVRLGVVDGGETSSSTKSYIFKHKDPKPGNHYYRLKMVDNDLSFEFSKIRNVHIDGNLSLSVFPNPLSSSVQVKGIYNPESRVVYVTVLSPDGKLLNKFETPATPDLLFNIPQSWPKGTLLIHVAVGGGTNKSLKVFNP